MALSTNQPAQAYLETMAERDALIARYIRPHPHEHGRAYAYIADTGPSVSAIIRSLLVGDRNLVEIARDWNVSEDAVRAAIAFYHRHKPYFDARFLLEDGQFESVFDE